MPGLLPQSILRSQAVYSSILLSPSLQVRHPPKDRQHPHEGNQNEMPGLLRRRYGRGPKLHHTLLCLVAVSFRQETERGCRRVKIQIPKGLPSTGWWMDNEIIHCYHGTFATKIMSIQEQGLLPGSSGLCYVTPDYCTAATFSLWGEEGIDSHIARNFRGGLRLYPANHYLVVHFAIPRDFIQEHGIYRTEPSTLFPNLTPPRLADRGLYDSFSGSSEKYYQNSECKFTCIVPAEYITGISFPYV